MVHWVHNGTIALENLRSGEAVGNEALVIGAAGRSLPNNELWRIELGKVTNQVACFRKVYATRKVSVRSPNESDASRKSFGHTFLVNPAAEVRQAYHLSADNISTQDNYTYSVIAEHVRLYLQ